MPAPPFLRSLRAVVIYIHGHASATVCCEQARMSQALKAFSTVQIFGAFYQDETMLWLRNLDVFPHSQTRAFNLCNPK